MSEPAAENTEPVDFDDILNHEGNREIPVKAVLANYLDEKTANDILAELDWSHDRKTSDLSDDERNDLLDLVEAYE